MRLIDADSLLEKLENVIENKDMFDSVRYQIDSEESYDEVGFQKVIKPRYINANDIKWYDLRENGLGDPRDMIAFKDEVDKLGDNKAVEQFIAERDTAVDQLKQLDIEFGEDPLQKAIPIKWLPQKLDGNDWHRMFSGTFQERSGAGKGWNACIDVILGELNEKNKSNR